VPHPKTLLARTSEDVLRGVEELGVPVVLKLRRGTEGKGVAKVTDIHELPAIADMVLATNQALLMQQLIKLPKNQVADTRAFGVDGEVIAAMRREMGAPKAGVAQDFRTNVSNGGVGSPTELHPRDIETAIESAEAHGLNVAGVDLMGRPGEMLVIENNSGAGHKIADITKVDVADAIARLTLGRMKQ
jgi:ribosomal protein S6--L-glutamate ligase